MLLEYAQLKALQGLVLSDDSGSAILKRTLTNSWTKRVIKIPKTPFMKLMTKKDFQTVSNTSEGFIRQLTDEFYLSFTYYCEVDVAIFENNLKARIVSVEPDMITVAVYMNKVGFTDESFFTLQVDVEILCREML